MSSIAGLALEPFCELVSLLDLHEIMALWICGFSALQWKLSHGHGVRNVAVWPGKSSKALWPPVVSNFHGLTYFKVHRPKFVVSTAVLSQNLSTLSRNLDTLSIHTQRAISAFDALMTIDSGHFPNLKSLELVSTAEIASLRASIPRTVTNLILGNVYYHVASLSLSDLPPGLLSLTCSLRTLEIPSPTSLFPMGLETLELYLSSYQPLFHRLPVACQSVALYLRSDAIVNLTNDDWSALSRISLKKLALVLADPIGVQEVLLLPRTLERLSLRFKAQYNVASWLLTIIPALPPNLTNFYDAWPEISPKIAKAMPRTLEMCFREVQCEAVSHLPPKTVEVHLTEYADISLISSFPAFLRTISLPFLTPHIASLLPHTLTTLTLYSDSAELTEANVKFLPPNLTFLKVDLRQQASSMPPFDNVRALEALPRTLTDLQLTTSYSAQEYFSIVRHVTPSESSLLLPRQLQRLELGCLDFSETNMTEWLLGLPSTITSLKLLVSTLPKGAFEALATNKIIVILDVTVLEEPEDGWAPCIESLPRNLGSLRFRLLSPNTPHPDSNITDASMLLAPPSINDLNIPKSPLLTSKGISHLHHLKWFSFANSLVEWFKPASSRKEILVEMW